MVCVRTWACICMYTPIETTAGLWIFYFITLYLITLRQGVSLSLELSWQEMSPSGLPGLIALGLQVNT